MAPFCTLLLVQVLSIVGTSFAFPSYESLAGLSSYDLETIIPTLKIQDPPPPPGPIGDTSAKLVNDKDHPWKPLEPEDIRGPCPGLNTLASHGYLPRSGVATPAQIIDAVQEGFNMGNGLAVFVTYAAHLVDGNLLTDLMSIGRKTRLTGPDPPKPAIVGGLNTHDVFEGDASLTRADDYFGDNYSFNETLFEEFTYFSNKFGAGKYNLTVAGEYRYKRIQDSIATNPNFNFVSPRFITAYAEATFPFLFFVDGRLSDGQLDLTSARKFLENNQMPDGFFRANRSIDFGEIPTGEVLRAYPNVRPGKNEGVGNYIVDPSSAGLNLCSVYTDFVNVTVRSLYPNPSSPLLRALNTNLDYFYSPIKGRGCPQVILP